MYNNNRGMKKKNTQNDAPFVALYDMHAVMFVLPDEMADVSIAGLQWFFLIPRLNHKSHVIPIPNLIYIEKKYITFGTRITNQFQSYESKGKQLFVSDFSLHLRHAIERGRGHILYNKKPRTPRSIIGKELTLSQIRNFTLLY